MLFSKVTKISSSIIFDLEWIKEKTVLKSDVESLEEIRLNHTSTLTF